MNETSIYGREQWADVDVGAAMRIGHPSIREGDELIVELVRARVGALGRPARVVDVGAGSAVLSRLLWDRLGGGVDVVANEVEPALVAMARRRLGDAPVEVFARPFEELERPLDIVISWGAHHHVPGSYLAHARRLLGPAGLLILGDEFCPEYCDDADRRRLAAAARLAVEDGYVLLDADVDEYRRRRVPPPWSAALEARRRRALWIWYRFVIDRAIAGDHWTVALSELQIAQDDLETARAHEHKLSPAIVERQLELAGLRVLRRHDLDQARPATLRSFAVYELAS